MVVLDDVHFTRNDKGFFVFFLTLSHSIAVLGPYRSLDKKCYTIFHFAMKKRMASAGQVEATSSK